MEQTQILATDAKHAKLKQHPVAAALMPGGMNDEEFVALCQDVADRGVLMPVTLFEGRVLDGWHRTRAAKEVDADLPVIFYEGKDPAGYITSANVLRRKMGSMQRAIVAARLHREYGLTQRAACKKLGLSNEDTGLVLKALDYGDKALIARIENDSDLTRTLLRQELEAVGVLKPVKPKKVKAVEVEEEEDEGEGEGDVIKLTPVEKLSNKFVGLDEADKKVFVKAVWRVGLQETLVSMGKLGEAPCKPPKQPKPAKMPKSAEEVFAGTLNESLL